MSFEDIKPRARPLVYWPDENLHQVATPVDDFGPELKQLVVDMLFTMKTQDGLGLAAPQVGVNKRVFVMDFSSIKSEHILNPLIFINPQILSTSEEQFEWKEGCLSVPGYFEKRNRPANVRIAYQDVDGEEHTATLMDLVAFAALHEYDHLEGKVFVDGASSFKQSRIQQKMRKTIKNKRRK